MERVVNVETSWNAQCVRGVPNLRDAPERRGVTAEYVDLDLDTVQPDDCRSAPTLTSTSFMPTVQSEAAPCYSGVLPVEDTAE